MTDTLQTPAQELTRDDAEPIFARWLADFASAIERQSMRDLDGLFAQDATLRDFMALRWDFTNATDRHALVPRLLELCLAANAAGFAPSTEQRAVAAGGSISAFFDFTTRDRVCRGYVLLVQGAQRHVAAAMQTQVIALADYPELTGARRREGKVYGVVPGRTRWTSDRAREAAFEDTDPAVLVLGAGHNGLAVAARLGALDVPTLVIDKEPRVGDIWRKRYAALALHSTVPGDHLPYLPLPSTWTAHTPKDKWADWLESYATLLDINVWTGTEFLKGSYDDEAQRWTIQVRRADGSIRALHPRHFVVAGGLFGTPKIPQIKGLAEFRGVAAHTDTFQDSASFDGKQVLVVGAGVSGHELAHDLWEHGAEVTMVQRSSTYVVTFDSYHKFWNSLFVEDMTYDPDFADQMAYSVPNTRTDAIHQRLVKLAAQDDKELLDRLTSVGFKLNWGPNGTGIIGAHMSGRDSYQIDIGASQLVADGRVRLKQGVEIAEIRDGTTAVFSDGSELQADLILFATGYHQFWPHIKPALGAVAAKIDKAYGRAADGEYANTWRRSAQAGLWFGTGFIRMARFYSRFTALLIKAIEEGIEPIDPERETARG